MKTITASGEIINTAKAGARPVEELRVQDLQAYGTIVRLAIALDEKACFTNVKHMNQLLADTLTLRDLYKKSHWQSFGPTFYQLHLLFDKHAGEQSQLADVIAERVQTLGGVSLAMAHDVAEMSRIPRATRGKERAPDQLSRLLHAHEIVLSEARTMARVADGNDDDGTNDLLVSQVIRTNELQVWFTSQHLISA